MSQKHLVCPHCGQHLPGTPSCRQEAVVCTACGRTVQHGAWGEPDPDAESGDAAGSGPDQPAKPALMAAATATRQGIPMGSGERTPSAAGFASGFFSHRKGDVLGFFTPILVLVAVIVGAFTWYFAFVLCPLLGYFVSLKLCQRTLTSGGRPVFKRYAISTLLGFVFWPIFWIFLVGFLGSLSDADEVVAGGNALGDALAVVFGLMAFGCALLCWAIAAVWCWRLASNDDRPPVPSECVGDAARTRSL